MKYIYLFVIAGFLYGCVARNKDVYTLDSVSVSKKVSSERESIADREGIYHNVQKGDTLYRISRDYDVEVNKIIQANKIKDASLIREGEILYIPEASKKVGYSISGFIWPLKGKIISSFGSLTERGENKGIDILSVSSNEVKAAKSGTVCYSGEHIKGYGKIIIIDHGYNFYTLYAYNESLLVKKGDKVKQGECIATLNKNDSVLHFEIRKEHKALNPIEFL